jgi:very-short-patch-repair endonuclease
MKPKESLFFILKSIFVNELYTEYKFHETRRFRFDYAVPMYKIAVEYEGIMGGKARHTTIKGYTKDCEKYNLANEMGWHVFRYTVLNVDQCYSNIQSFLRHKQK